MRKKTFSEEPVALALREPDMRTPFTEVCRKMGCPSNRSTGESRSICGWGSPSFGGFGSWRRRTASSRGSWPTVALNAAGATFQQAAPALSLRRYF